MNAKTAFFLLPQSTSHRWQQLLLSSLSCLQMSQSTICTGPSKRAPTLGSVLFVSFSLPQNIVTLKLASVFFFSFFSPWPTPIAVHGVVFANIRAKPICTRLTVSFRSAQSIVHPAHSMYSPAHRNSIQLLRLLSAPNNRTARTYTPVIWWCQNGSRYSIRILCVQFRAGCRAVHITKVDTLPIIQPQTNKYKEYIQTLRSILSIFSVQTHKVTVDIFWNRRSSGVFALSHRCSTANQIK